MSANILVVFTAKTVDQILEAGGTQSWVLNQHSMRGVAYVVCTRNADSAHDEECGVRTEQHNAAFLVGKVSGMTKVDHRNDRDRYRVNFSEYAMVIVLGFRDASTRNPVTYSNMDQCKLNGLEIDALDFKPMPTVAMADSAMGKSKRGLSIAEAKEGLSIYFDVPIASIQIAINA